MLGRICMKKYMQKLHVLLNLNGHIRVLKKVRKVLIFLKPTNDYSSFKGDSFHVAANIHPMWWQEGTNWHLGELIVLRAFGGRWFGKPTEAKTRHHAAWKHSQQYFISVQESYLYVNAQRSELWPGLFTAQPGHHKTLAVVAAVNYRGGRTAKKKRTTLTLTIKPWQLTRPALFVLWRW